MTDLSALFDPFPVLTTERLILRQMTMADVPAIQVLISDPRVMRYMGKDPTDDIQASVEKVERNQRNFKALTEIRWALTLKADSDSLFLGDVSLHHINTYDSHAELGYALGHDHWGKGLMNEAIQAVLGFGFGPLGMHRIEANIDIENARSKAVLERNGFQYDGSLRERFRVVNGYADEHYFSILQREWQARQSASG
ncbi:MAG: GNAT family N-acetyltransferase [Pleurocapsa minor GSE-CHR-MK-17-07R]|jgi:ribosomal-protein-alanine N-acetyltransferase|nr:GNAT family N-acetyltransferase [Pleurocapsa minor GSE-CHR-MK 17-07R]